MWVAAAYLRCRSITCRGKEARQVPFMETVIYAVYLDLAWFVARRADFRRCDYNRLQIVSLELRLSFLMIEYETPGGMRVGPQAERGVGSYKQADHATLWGVLSELWPNQKYGVGTCKRTFGFKYYFWQDSICCCESGCRAICSCIASFLQEEGLPDSVCTLWSWDRESCSIYSRYLRQSKNPAQIGRWCYERER